MISLNILNLKKYFNKKKIEKLVFNGINKKNDGNYDEAINIFEEVIALDKNNYKPYFWIAETLLLKGEKKLSLGYYVKSKKIQLNLKNNQIEPIFFNSLPKSGSVFMNSFFEKNLKLQKINLLFGQGFTNQTLSTKLFDKFSSTPSSFSHCHVQASKDNLSIISANIEKIFMLVRDPRQVLISYVHHLRRKPVHKYDLTFINEKDNYFNLSFEEQLEWCLKNGLYRDIIDFIQGWIEVEKFKKFPGKILILTQEELVTKKDFFFKQLMNFYNIDDNKYSIPNDPKFNSKTSYRKGSINEWKTVFNNSQKEYALNLITKDMRERFKWS